jgi:hypothetical protein
VFRSGEFGAHFAKLAMRTGTAYTVVKRVQRFLMLSEKINGVYVAEGAF